MTAAARNLSEYSSYKPSGADWIGEVPSHWDVARFKHGLRLVTEKSTGHHFKVALENIESWTGRYIGTDATYEGEGTSFRAGDILFGKLRPYLAKALLASSNGQAVGDFHVLRPETQTNSRFVQYFILSREFISIVDGSTYGAKMPRASWDFISSLPLPLPPFAEQAAIAAFLDRETAKIDALVEEQKRLIDLLKEKRQAVISQGVTKGLNPDAPMKDTGIEWLGEVPDHWEIGPLKRHWAVTDCKHLTAEFVDDGVPLASIRECQSKYVDLSNAKQTTIGFYEELIGGGRKPKAGDLIFTRNATVGAVAQVASWHPEFAMGQDVCLLQKVERGQSTDFLQFALGSAAIRQQLDLTMIGSTFKRVNVEEIRNLIIAFAPRDEQEAIVELLDKQTNRLDDLVEEAHSAVSLLQERRAALISAAVTGKIDVRSAAQTRDAAE